MFALPAPSLLRGIWAPFLVRCSEFLALAVDAQLRISMMHVYVYMYIHMYLHAYIYIYMFVCCLVIYIYMYIHMCVCKYCIVHEPLYVADATYCSAPAGLISP